jgi:hypothetical protein
MISIFRTIIEQRTAQQELDAKRKVYSRLDELWRGLGWRICREPEKGWVIKHKGSVYYSRIIDPEVYPALPGIFVVYTFDENTVNVLFVRIDPPPT